MRSTTTRSAVENLVDIRRKDYNSTLSDGHDDFDQALQQDTRNHLDDAANILDDYEGGQLGPTVVDPAAGLSSFKPHFAPTQYTTRSSIIPYQKQFSHWDQAFRRGRHG